MCVREDHRDAGREAVNAVVAVDLAAGGAGEVLVSGSDFYGYPAVSPDGTRLAWLAWNHPHMPWDETELWVADLRAGGSVAAPRKIAGGRGESVFQPEWSPDGVLHFVSDRSGWWNLYRWRDGQCEAMAPMQAEFGAPAWQLGARTYAFESAGRIVCRYVREGRWHVAALDTRSKRLAPVETPFTEALFKLPQNGLLRVSGHRLSPAVHRNLTTASCTRYERHATVISSNRDFNEWTGWCTVP